MHLHQLTRTRQPQACSGEASDDVGPAMESVEDVRLVVARDTDPFVAYDEQRGLAFGSLDWLDRDAPRASFVSAALVVSRSSG